MYDLTTGEIKYTHTFERPVRSISVNTHKSALNEFNRFDCLDLFLAVIFDDSSMDMYKIQKSREDKRQFSFIKMRSIPSSGHSIVSNSFGRSNYLEFDFDFFVCVYENGSIIFFPNFEEENFRLVKLSMRPSSSLPLILTPTFRLIYNDSITGSDMLSHLFVNKSTGSIMHISHKRDEEKEGHVSTYEIEGSFDRVVFLTEKKIAAISLGTVTFYVLSFAKQKYDNKDHTNLSDDDEYKLTKGPVELSLIRVAEIDAHFDEISFLFKKGKTIGEF